MRAPSTQAAAVVALALLAGCAIGPNYERPPVASQPEYRGLVGPAEAASLADLPWWEVFEDPVLRGLVETALENNLDLRKAVARVDRAREGVGIARSEIFPQIGGNAGGARQQSPVVDPSDNRKFNVFGAAFNAAWELDVWGRIRRSTEAAQADYLATEEARQAFADRQAEASSAELSRIGGICLAERPEEPGDLLSGHADTGVDDVVLDSGLFRRRLQELDGKAHLADFGELDGVAQKIDEDLA